MSEELTTEEAAKLTGYSKKYLWELCQTGKIKARKVVRDWLIDKESLLAWKERASKHPRGGPRKKDE